MPVVSIMTTRYFVNIPALSFMLAWDTSMDSFQRLVSNLLLVSTYPSLLSTGDQPSKAEKASCSSGLKASQSPSLP